MSRKSAKVREEQEMPGSLRDPRVWGPQFWKTYDIIADTFPEHPSEKQRHAARSFFESQKHLIPCKKCARHYKKILRQYPVQTRNRQELQAWLQIVKAEERRERGAPAPL
jgi:FAD-linked sulfhydryl oxidase